MGRHAEAKLFRCQKLKTPNGSSWFMIQGRPTGGHHHGTGYAVFVDGAELHVMRNADGSWISVVGHYAPVPSPRDAARAAVEELQGASLVPFD